MAFQTNKVFLFLTLLFFLNFVSFCQSNAPHNIGTLYPAPPPSTPTSFPPSDPPTQPKYPTSKKAIIVTAVGVTSASTIVVVGFLFILCTKFAGPRKKEVSNAGRLQSVAETDIGSVGENDRGHIADENGLDVVYLRKLEGSKTKSKPISGWKRIFSSRKSLSPSDNQVHPKDDQNVKLGIEQAETSQVVVNVAPSLPPPPPPPPVQVKKCPAPPPPPPKGGAQLASSRPPPAPKRPPSENVVDDGSEDRTNQVKLKALHWEKVNVVNRGHSMVWDKIEHGSFQCNDDMIEALFGSTTTPQKSAIDRNSSAVNNQAAKIFILDSRRSQNIAIIIRTLATPIEELINGLLEGNGLNIETLEKLTRMSPTKEEKIQILTFDGQVEILADAESFLYRILKFVPSAFTRVNAMLFRHTYDSEIQYLKDSLQTLDSACNELRSRGMFLKLLEATLKAGNRVNAGTARGDAKAFNLTALHKLSDYKGSNGKTTLLYFVVHEVVRNEGRRFVINNSSPSLNSDEISKSKENQEWEFLELGLPIISGLSSELSNVKKSATFDYDTLLNISTMLGAHIDETRQLVLQCEAEGGQGEFVKEMQDFLGRAEEEIKAVKEEETRVIEFVKKTTQYYQSGAFKDNQPLQLFAIVKDFLLMVDKACVDIFQSLQQKKVDSPSVVFPSTDVLSTRVTFSRLPEHFVTEKINGSDSYDDY